MQTPSGPALVCQPLETVAPHLFTSRNWRLGTPSLTRPEHEQAWREVAAAVGVEPECVVTARQVHGDSVLVASAEHRSSPEAAADIIVCADRQLAVAVRTADCVPILIVDRRLGVVAAVHAGWRGLAARVPQKAVQALTRTFGSRPHDLVVAAGPAIGPCCYEVGETVRERFQQAGFGAGAIERWFLTARAETTENPSIGAVRRPPRREHWFFDAWSSARDQLESEGVARHHILVAEVCTASHDVLCSYRRDGVNAGRLAAVIRCASPGPSPC